jgi:hypothetical protein
LAKAVSRLREVLAEASAEDSGFGVHMHPGRVTGMRSVRRRAWLGALLAVCVAAGSVPLVGAELVDRVLAVVSGTVITLSDARVAIAFRDVDAAGAADPIVVALRWLVDRQLVLDEVSRYSDTAALDPRRIADGVARIRAAYPSEAAFAQALERLGLDVTGCRRWVEGTLLMQDYLARRFDTTFPPTDDELRDYHARHLARFARGGVPLPFDEAREDVRAALQQERRREAVEVGMTRLRRRANVSELYAPVRQAR